MAKNSAASLLTSVDSLFTTQEERDIASQPRVQEIPVDQIDDFPNHPFKVRMDESMMEMADSVKQHGILVPVIVRPKEGGRYEMIAGHRRKLACTLIAKLHLPCIVRELTDEEATVIMVDSNLQREQLLPSEKAFAYKMKLEAMKHQGQRGDLTSDQVGQKSWAVNQLADDANESKTQVQRFIRLTNLIPEILDMVDEKKIAFNPAVELSYLKPSEQKEFLEAMDYAQASPSLSQAQRLKKLSQEGDCTLDAMCEVMNEIKKDELDHVTIKNEVLRKYFPKSYTPKQMQDTIIRLLEKWQRSKQRDMER